MYFEGKKQIGPCVGAPPRGKDCRISVMMLLTIADGKIIEKRAHFDAGDIYRQLTA
jgi:predicted ester cyclase